MIDQYITEYGKRLYGLCLYLCKRADIADDLYQETWLKACTKIESYDISKPFEAWLTKICVNAYRDMLRKAKRNLNFEGFADEDEKAFAIENVPSNEAEDFSALHCAVEALPEKLRVTVILHYFNDLDQKVTAQIFGIPLGTVKSRLNKAKTLLKKELEDEKYTF